MKCYLMKVVGPRPAADGDTRKHFSRVDNGTVADHFDVSEGGRSLYAGGVKAQLSDELRERLRSQIRTETFRFGLPAIHSCDAEKRSEVWLTPETPQTRNQALLGAELHVPRLTDFRQSIEGTGEILGHQLSQWIGSKDKSICILAVLSPKSTLVVSMNMDIVLVKSGICVLKSTHPRTRRVGRPALAGMVKARYRILPSCLPNKMRAPIPISEDS